MPKIRSRNQQRQFSLSRSEEHTSELQSHSDLVCRLLLEKTDPWAVRPLRVSAHGSPDAPPPRVSRLRVRAGVVWCLQRGDAESDRCLRDFFFLKDAATPELFPLSLHDALPF